MNLIPAFIYDRIIHRPNLLKIVNNIGWLYLEKVLRMGIGLVVGVWLARHLGPAQFGLFSFAGALVGIFSAIASLGLNSLVIREVTYVPEKKQEILGTAALLQFLSGLLCYGMVLATIYFLRPDDTLAMWLVALMGSALLFKASDCAVYWFESQVQSKYIARAQIIVYSFFSLCKILLILNDAHLIMFAWVVFIETAVFSLLLLVIMNKYGIALHTIECSLTRAKKLLNDTWPILIAALALTLNVRVDQIMLGQIAGDHAVGVYSAATRISETWAFIPTLIVSTVFPVLLKTQKTNEQLFYVRLQKLFDLMSILGLTVATLVSLFSDHIIKLLFDSSYFESSLILSIQVWTSIFVFLSVVSGRWFIAMDLQRISMQRYLLGFILNIVLNAILIPIYSSTGAAIALILSTIIYAFLFDFLHKKTRHIFWMKLNSLNIIGGFFRAFHSNKSKTQTKGF